MRTVMSTVRWKDYAITSSFGCMTPENRYTVKLLSRKIK